MPKWQVIPKKVWDNTAYPLTVELKKDYDPYTIDMENTKI